jgi:hypothetical protein
MAHFVSDGGVLHPAKEHVVLPHLSGTDKEIYDGPDRAAMEMLAEAYGVDENGYPLKTTFGMPFLEDPLMIDLARQLGYKDVMEYAKSRGYDPEHAKKIFEARAAVVEKYKESKRAPEPIKIGGGGSTAPGNEPIIGGFGEEKIRKISEVQK